MSRRHGLGFERRGCTAAVRGGGGGIGVPGCGVVRFACSDDTARGLARLKRVSSNAGAVQVPSSCDARHTTPIAPSLVTDVTRGCGRRCGQTCGWPAARLWRSRALSTGLSTGPGGVGPGYMGGAAPPMEDKRVGLLPKSSRCSRRVQLAVTLSGGPGGHLVAPSGAPKSNACTHVHTPVHLRRVDRGWTPQMDTPLSTQNEHPCGHPFSYSDQGKRRGAVHPPVHMDTPRP